MRDWRSAILAVPLAVALGVAVPLLPALAAGLAVGSVQFGFIVLVAVIAIRGAVLCVKSLRESGKLTHLGSLIAAAGTLLAVSLPGAQLLAGSRISRLASLGRPSADISSDVVRAYGLFA